MIYLRIFRFLAQFVLALTQTKNNLNQYCLFYFYDYMENLFRFNDNKVTILSQKKDCSGYSEAKKHCQIRISRNRQDFSEGSFGGQGK